MRTRKQDVLTLLLKSVSPINRCEPLEEERVTFLMPLENDPSSTLCGKQSKAIEQLNLLAFSDGEVIDEKTLYQR